MEEGGSESEVRGEVRKMEKEKKKITCVCECVCVCEVKIEELQRSERNKECVCVVEKK